MKNKEKFNTPAALTCSKGSLAYKSAMSAIAELGRVVSTGKNTGSGRHSSSTEWTYAAMAEIRAHGYTAVRGNNAPKGGKNGEFVVAY